MKHLKGQPCPNIRSTDDLDPVVAALRQNESFDRAQVAWLMSLAGRWGYDAGYEDGLRDEQALASVASAYALLGTYSGENTAREVKKVERRRESDEAARLPRLGDYLGGPLAAWGEDEIEAAA
jgi:hypothetical protein